MAEHPRRGLIAAVALLLAAPASAGPAGGGSTTPPAGPSTAPTPSIAAQVQAELDQQAAVVHATTTTVASKRADAATVMRDSLRAAYRVLRADADGGRDPERWLVLARRRALARWGRTVDHREFGLLDRELVMLRGAAERLAHDQAQARTLPPLPALAWPAAGEVVRGFGAFERPGSGATLSRRGLDVEVGAGVTVRAPADGVVRYVGPIRGLDHGVILDHGAVSTVIAKLAAPATEPTVTVGQTVAAGAAVGTVARQRYYLEVRVRVGAGGTAIDPRTILPR